MQYRQLGQWGLRLSTVGLGSYLTIGMHVDDEESKRCVDKAIELGINWFDTANGYNHGRAEEVLGDCLADYPRDSFVLTTKVWAPMGEGPNDRGLSAKHVREQCQASLRRLKMDYIDLYLCHRPDPDTPLEETIRVMDDLARQGKIIYWGVSEWPAGLIAEAVGLAREMGCRPPVANEPRGGGLPHLPPTGAGQRGLLPPGPRGAHGEVHARPAPAAGHPGRQRDTECGPQEDVLDRRHPNPLPNDGRAGQGDGRARRQDFSCYGSVKKRPSDKLSGGLVLTESFTAWH